MPAMPRPNYTGYSKKVSLMLELEQRYGITSFVKKRMKGVDIIDRRNKHYGRHALQ
jgi:hypothetical protein